MSVFPCVPEALEISPLQDVAPGSWGDELMVQNGPGHLGTGGCVGGPGC